MKSTFIILLILTIVFSISAKAGVIEANTWNSNEEGGTVVGNYSVQIDNETHPGFIYFFVTVEPWNAEALGLFIDFGDFDASLAGDVDPLSNVIVQLIPQSDDGDPVDVSLLALDTESNDCGNGCNLNGFPIDGVEWEMVYRLNTNGSADPVQTTAWKIDIDAFSNETFKNFLRSDDALSADYIALRSQSVCSGDGTLDGSTTCGGSEKTYWTGGPRDPRTDIPEPHIWLMFGLGFIGLMISRRKNLQR
ncbi:PEP-CTERM sorting domain-containing protein [Thalassotalea maritima]|uniref:PEP-CTERM sorting domain-containing protein n=1 Tax=Thalassotalea maritima TaxID=3242416 RepID=UPI003527F49D